MLGTLEDVPYTEWEVDLENFQFPFNFLQGATQIPVVVLISIS